MEKSTNMISSFIELEHLINLIIENKVAISFFFKDKHQFSATILSFDKEILTLQHNCKLPMVPYQDLSFLFFLRENRHTFTSTIKSIINSQTLTIMFPDVIKRNIQRRFPRVVLNDVKKITITYRDINTSLKFPQTQNFTVFSDSDISKNTLSLDATVAHFRTKMSIYSKNSIIMLRDKELQGFEEFIIVKTGKSFYIPNSSKDFPASQFYDVNKVITYEDIYDYEVLMGTQDKDIPSKINSILLQKSKQGILSELYFPLIYKKFVIGYIYLMNKIDKNTHIPYTVLTTLEEYRKLLLSSLIQIRYFEKMEIKNEDVNLTDISAGGILFSTNNNSLFDSLNENDQLIVAFTYLTTGFTLNSEVRRKFTDKDQFFFGIEFVKNPQEKIDVLKTLIYPK